MCRILCIEGYVENNLGDDLMFKNIIENTNYDEYIVLGSENGITYPIKKKIKFISKEKFKRMIIKDFFLKFKSRNIDLAYVGGSLFMDRGNGKVARGKQRFSFLCRLVGIKTFVVGSNLGPIHNEKRYTKNILKFSKLVQNWSVRDKFSYDFLRNLGVKNVQMLPDIVFSTDIKDFKIKNDKKVCISIIRYEDASKRYDSKNSENYYKDIIEWANYFHQNEYSVKLLSFQNQADISISTELIKEIPFAEIVSYEGENILEEISTSEYIIATRFHSAILGALFGKKMVVYSYNSKTKNYLNSKNFEILKFGEKKDIKLFEKLEVKNSEIENSFEYSRKLMIGK